MSSAIHSEVVELVLSIDRFEKQIKVANDTLNTLQQTAAIPLQIKVNAHDTVIAMLQAQETVVNYRKEVEATDRAIQQMMAHQQRQVTFKRDGKGSVTGFGEYTPDQRTNNAARYATAYKEQLNWETKLSETQAARSNSMTKYESIALEWALKKQKAERDALDALVKQADAEKNKIRQQELSDQLTQRIAIHEYGVLQTMLAQTRAAEAAAIKKTAAYGVGNTIVNGKVGALATAAASGSFLVGANNLGGMFYMMERMSYATGIGQKKLGEFAQSLGLVKLEGEGAEASIAKFGLNVMKLGGVVAGLAVPIATMFAGNKLNTHLAEMSTLLADATVKGEEFDSMLNKTTASAVKLAGQFGTGVTEVVDGFKLALSTGIDADQLERFTEVALTMGKGLGASLSQSVSILTTFKDAFAGTVEATVGYSDVLFNAINVGKFNVEQLNANIGRVAVTAAEAGVSFKDMMAALATLNRVGMSTSQAITSLNQMIVSIVNPSDKAKKAMDSLGIAYGAAALKGRSLTAVIADIKAKIGSNNDMYGEIFSEERARRGAIGLAANPGLMTSNRAEMEKQGTAAIAAARAMDTFSAQMGKIWSTISSVIQAVGSDLLNIAKDIFFPSGAMGKDTLATIAVTMEVIGVAIKEVGIVLLGVVGVAWNLLKVLGSIAVSLVHLFSGEFTKAATVVGDALYDLGVGIGNSVKAMFTTVNESADRSFEYLRKTGEEVAKVGDASDKTADKVKGISNAFGEMDVVSDTTATKIEAKFEKARAKLEEVRVAALKAKIAMETPDVSSEEAPDEFSKLPGVRGTYTFAKYRQSAKDVQDIQKRMNAFGDGDKTQAWADLVKEREEAVLRLQESHKKLMDLVDKQREEWAKKKKEDNIAKKEEAQGIGAKQAKDMYGGFQFKEESSPDSILNVTAALDKLLALREKIISSDMPKLEAMTVSQLQGRLGTLTDQLSEAAKAYNLINANAKDMDKASYAKAMLQVEQQRKDIIKDIDDTEKQLAKTKAQEYRKEYDAALKLYNVKMSFYDKEIAKIELVIRAYDNIINNTKEKRLELNVERRGAGYAERMYRDSISTGLRDVRSMDDPKEAANKLKDIEKLIEKFLDAAKANNDGSRGAREAEDFYAVVEKIAEANRTKEINAQTKMYNVKDKAKTDLETSMQDNPVAQAAFARADQLVKAALDTAAKHGLSVSGDLVSEVNIDGIDVNLPVADMRNAIIATVKIEMKKVFDDIAKNNPKPNEASTAAGAP